MTTLTKLGLAIVAFAAILAALLAAGAAEGRVMSDAILGLVLGLALVMLLFGVFVLGHLTAMIKVNQSVFGRWLERWGQSINAGEITGGANYEAAWADFEAIPSPDARVVRLVERVRAMVQRRNKPAEARP